MARPGFFRLKLLAACLVLAAAAILSRSLWLPALGYALVHDDGPAKADIAVVLAGDYEGHRIEKAAADAAAGRCRNPDRRNRPASGANRRIG